jgi:hypothetical protein
MVVVPQGTAQPAERDDREAWARRLSTGVLVGFLTGAAVGGVGGRIAMFVLRLTSSPSLRGVETDDGFTIGAFSAATIFLVFIAAFAGVVAGMSYLVVRRWLPARSRPWLAAAFAGVTGGALLVHPDGIDFRVLEPLPLAIAIFIAIPAAYGLVISLFVERRLARPVPAEGSSPRWMAGLLPMILLLFAGPLGVLTIAVTVLAGALHTKIPALLGAWGSAPVVWLGRSAMAVVAVLAGAALARTIAEIL